MFPVCLRLLLGPLGAVKGTALHALCNTSGIKSAADDVITDTGQVTHFAAADKNDGVLLQVVADTGNIAGTFDAVRQTNTSDLAERRVRLLGRLGLNGQAHAALLVAILQNRRIGLVTDLFPTMTDKLIDCRHGKHLLNR